MEELHGLCAPQDDIGYLIWKVTKFWHRGKLKMLEDYELTTSQLEVLGAVFWKNKTETTDLTQVILSQETDIDPMTISTILRNLQKKGLINRTESKSDTRARIVEITDLGSDLFLKALRSVKEKQDILFANIDKEALKAQLRILLEELDKQKNDY
ncbi:MAG: hypothetical protein RL662_1061 [Bacteroidota bacterium]|jgi:DNA-binding MarR family transcriptional regulator